MSAERKILDGRYEITQYYNQGGMATVYKGVDLEINQPVAIKLLKREIVEAEPGLVERFSREAEALRVLNHPNIVKVLATIEHENENYVVMEFVGGGDLRTLLERERLSVQRTLEIALDLSDALTRAHRLKIIHRDIKPANVLLADDGTPRLTDFGIARIGDSRMTQTGQMMGTLAYMSPEGCVGDALDHRTDIWAFGVMIYEMLAGRRPFDDTDGNQAALLLGILSNPITPVREYCPEAPPALEQLLELMLQKDREQRINSVRQVGAHLEAIISGRAVDSLEEANEGTSNYPLVDKTPIPRTPTQKVLAQLQHEATEIAQKQATSAGTAESKSPVQAVVVSPTPLTYRQGPNPVLVVSGAVLLLILIGAVVILSQNRPSGGTTRTPIAVSTAEVPLVEAVQPDEFMVLVAPLELVGGTTEDVTRFIVDDLQRKFEREVLYSKYRIRRYPNPVMIDADAREIADANGAVIVIWGDYDGTVARVNVQIGSLAGFKDLWMPRDRLDLMSNVRLLMTNPREQSVAAHVLGVMNTIQTAADDSYQVALNLAILEVVDPLSPEVEGNSAAAHWHRYFSHFIEGGEAALSEIDAAIGMDGGNPVLYMARGLSYTREGNVEAARRDYRTAREAQMLPDTAIVDDLFLGMISLLFDNDPQAAADEFEKALEVKPDDWFSLYYRGVAYFMIRDFEQANHDLERTRELNPDFQALYPFTSGLALRRGDLVQSQADFATVRTRFPDPTFTTRLIGSSLDETPEDSPIIAAVSAFTSFSLLQWDDVIEKATAATQLGDSFPLADVYFMLGVAECNVGNYPASEAAYTKMVELEPDYTVGYLLRSEVRNRQGNIIGAGADLTQLLRSGQVAVFTPFIPAYRTGEIGCENFFNVDYAQYIAAATAQAALTPTITP